MSWRFSVSAIALLLSGCMLGPDYQPPEIDTIACCSSVCMPARLWANLADGSL